jgi:hypothetical protein
VQTSDFREGIIETYYGHSKPLAPIEEWEELEDHLRADAERAQEFAGAWGPW